MFAWADSRAPALQGLRKRVLGIGQAGEPGTVEVVVLMLEVACKRSDGERRREEKERRYREMKKSSLKVEKRKGTIWLSQCSMIIQSGKI